MKFYVSRHTKMRRVKISTLGPAAKQITEPWYTELENVQNLGRSGSSGDLFVETGYLQILVKMQSYWMRVDPKFHMTVPIGEDNQRQDSSVQRGAEPRVMWAQNKEHQWQQPLPETETREVPP